INLLSDFISFADDDVTFIFAIVITLLSAVTYSNLSYLTNLEKRLSNLENIIDPSTIKDEKIKKKFELKFNNLKYNLSKAKLKKILEKSENSNLNLDDDSMPTFNTDNTSETIKDYTSLSMDYTNNDELNINNIDSSNLNYPSYLNLSLNPLDPEDDPI